MKVGKAALVEDHHASAIIEGDGFEVRKDILPEDPVDFHTNGLTDVGEIGTKYLLPDVFVPEGKLHTEHVKGCLSTDAHYILVALDPVGLERLTIENRNPGPGVQQEALVSILKRNRDDESVLHLASKSDWRSEG